MNVPVIVRSVDRILRAYGLRGTVLAEQAEHSQYLTFQFCRTVGAPLVFDMPISNRSNGTDAQIADDVANHLLDEATKP